MKLVHQFSIAAACAVALSVAYGGPALPASAGDPTPTPAGPPQHAMPHPSNNHRPPPSPTPEPTPVCRLNVQVRVEFPVQERSSNVFSLSVYDVESEDATKTTLTVLDDSEAHLLVGLKNAGTTISGAALVCGNVTRLMKSVTITSTESPPAGQSPALMKVEFKYAELRIQTTT